MFISWHYTPDWNYQNQHIHIRSCGKTSSTVCSTQCEKSLWTAVWPPNHYYLQSAESRNSTHSYPWSHLSALSVLVIFSSLVLLRLLSQGLATLPSSLLAWYSLHSPGWYSLCSTGWLWTHGNGSALETHPSTGITGVHSHTMPKRSVFNRRNKKRQIIWLLQKCQ